MPNAYVPITLSEVLQLLLALGCGLAIGFERELRGKPAGVTTVSIVTIASTLVMQLGFRWAEMAGGVTAADPARIAAAVVTGIGFLGAGMIVRERPGHVYGINTAATIWCMSCVGLAIGSGWYVGAGIVTLLVYGRSCWNVSGSTAWLREISAGRMSRTTPSSLATLPALVSAAPVAARPGLPMLSARGARAG